MDFLEKDLEDIIFNTSYDELSDRGLFIGPIKRRQVSIGNYGRVDIIAFTKMPGVTGENTIRYPDPIEIDIIELKNKEINYSAFIQAIGYAKGVKEYLNKRNIKFEYNINIILIGREMDLKSSFAYIPDIFSNVYLYTYKYNFNGIYFEPIYTYKLTDPGF